MAFVACLLLIGGVLWWYGVIRRVARYALQARGMLDGAGARVAERGRVPEQVEADPWGDGDL